MIEISTSAAGRSRRIVDWLVTPIVPVLASEQLFHFQSFCGALSQQQRRINPTKACSGRGERGRTREFPRGIGGEIDVKFKEWFRSWAEDPAFEAAATEKVGRKRPENGGASARLQEGIPGE